MRRAAREGVLGALAAAAFAAGGCGGGADADGTRDRGSRPTATTTATAGPKPKDPVRRAHSTASCLRLWNAEEVGNSSYQVTAKQFVAELAAAAHRTPVRVSHRRGSCFVVAPIGHRRVAVFTAAHGRRPFSIPDRVRLRPGERVGFNAVARRDGSLRRG